MLRALSAVLTFIAVVTPASAQPEPAGSGSVHGRGSLYLDDDDTRVVTALVDGEVALPADARVGAHALADVISAASVDVVSAATPGFDEVRIEAGGKAGMFVTPEVDVLVSFIHSQENDWRSESPAATLSFDLLQRNTKLVLGYGLSHNTIGRAGDPTFEQRLLVHTAEVGASQVLDGKSLVGLRYTLQRADGWQSSPYRYVTADTFSALERHPESRMRHGITTTGLRWLTSGAGLEASYRFYIDDWGVMSHTLTTALRLELYKHWDMRIRARGYYQVAADFWQAQYGAPMRYMSVDRELSTFWDVGGGLKLGWHDERWDVAAKLDGTYYRFVDYARLAGRVALVSDLGVGVTW